MVDGSYYENLTIYKTGLDLVIKLDDVVRKFPQYHKYTIGTELRQAAIAIVRLIAKANRRQNRVEKVTQLCDEVEDFKILCNIGKDVKAFQSFKQYAGVMNEVMHLARQAEGWRKKSTFN